MSVALVVVFGSEILTPDDALFALGLPPLLAAMWMLSGRWSAIISDLALVSFTVVLFAEPANRLTIISIGVVAAILAAAVRLYAISLCDVLLRQGSHQAVRHASATLATGVRFHGFGSLTRREIEVARLASGGYTDSEIANDLGISDRTVESHLAHVYAKLGVKSRRTLIRMSANGAMPIGASEPVQRMVPGPRH
jgi:DNA-binding CsgD family transcriptional regulator